MSHENIVGYRDYTRYDYVTDILHYYNKLITDSGFIIICIYPYVNWKPKHTTLWSLYFAGMASKFLRFLTHPKSGFIHVFCSHVVIIFHAPFIKTWGFRSYGCFTVSKDTKRGNQLCTFMNLLQSQKFLLEKPNLIFNLIIAYDLLNQRR